MDGGILFLREIWKRARWRFGDFDWIVREGGSIDRNPRTRDEIPRRAISLEFWDMELGRPYGKRRVTSPFGRYEALLGENRRRSSRGAANFFYLGRNGGDM